MGCLVLATGFSLYICLITKWIEIDYKDHSGIRKKAFFADGSGYFGLGGIFGGTQKMFKQLTIA